MTCYNKIFAKLLEELHYWKHGQWIANGGFCVKCWRFIDGGNI